MRWRFAEPQDCPPNERAVNPTGDTAYSGSNWEYYQSLRPCQQKFSRIVIEELEKALKSQT